MASNRVCWQDGGGAGPRSGLVVLPALTLLLQVRGCLFLLLLSLSLSCASWAPCRQGRGCEAASHWWSLGGELSSQVLCPAQSPAHQGAPFLTSGLAWPLPQPCGSVLINLRWSLGSLMGRSWASFLLRRSHCTVLSHRFLSADLCSRGSRERLWSPARGGAAASSAAPSPTSLAFLFRFSADGLALGVPSRGSWSSFTVSAGCGDLVLWNQQTVVVAGDWHLLPASPTLSTGHLVAWPFPTDCTGLEGWLLPCSG